MSGRASRKAVSKYKDPYSRLGPHLSQENFILKILKGINPSFSEKNIRVPLIFQEREGK